MDNNLIPGAGSDISIYIGHSYPCWARLRDAVPPVDPKWGRRTQQPKRVGRFFGDLILEF